MEDEHDSRLDERLLIQRIKSGIQTGKTTLLANIAKGARASGFSVAYITFSVDLATEYKKRHGLTGIDVFHYDWAIKQRKLSLGSYDYVLLDDCDRMPQEEGDPAELVKSLYKHLGFCPVIVATYLK